MFSKVRDDASLSAIMAGIIAVAVSYAGPLLIVFQAAKAAQLSDALLSSWIWAISFSSGIIGLFLSIRFKSPVITAWSTPGAVLLVSSWANYAYAEAIGAFILSAILTIILGVSGLFSTVMDRIPQSIIAAMLAGILLKFGVDVFISLQQLPIITVPMVLCYLLAKRCMPRYCVAVTFLIGILSAIIFGYVNTSGISISLVEPVFTTPVFSMQALIGLGIPLCIVAMTAQNATGIGVLKVDGYNTPASPIITAAGAASLIFAPFGSHGVNLAAITAAICTGREAHEDKNKRYIAGIVCGLLYITVSIFGGTISSVFSALPSTLITVLAGLALFGSISASLSAAMNEERYKEAALITFLVTISGISILGVGSAFWGLVTGVVAKYMLTLHNTREEARN
jgi:benzoate membrane transport protein